MARRLRGFITRIRRRAVVFAAAGALAIAVDHATKFAAALWPPAAYTHNPYGHGTWWVILAVSALSVLSSRAAAVCGGIAIGAGLSNLIDAAVWPGGVSDFIEVRSGTANVADVLIGAGLVGLVVAIAVSAIRAAISRKRARAALRHHRKTEWQPPRPPVNDWRW